MRLKKDITQELYVEWLSQRRKELRPHKRMLSIKILFFEYYIEKE
jgi:hypothetical protein